VSFCVEVTQIALENEWGIPVTISSHLFAGTSVTTDGGFVLSEKRPMTSDVGYMLWLGALWKDAEETLYAFA